MNMEEQKSIDLKTIRAKVDELKKGGPLTAQRKAELAAEVEGLLDRIDGALGILVATAQIDGAHHKMWTLDQVARALTACPTVKATAKGSNGKMYEYEKLGKSNEYKKFIKDYCAGEDGPKTYEWDEGSPP